VDTAIGRANDERRLDPRSFAHLLRQILPAHHCEQRNQRCFAFLENHGPTADDRELGRARCVFDARQLLLWKDAREYASNVEVPGGNTAVVGDVPAQFEAAGDFLWVVAVNPRIEWKIRRAAENQVESLVFT
jgi:hypothetical protein